MAIKYRLLIALLLVFTSLFSGQTMARQQGHRYLVVHSGDSLLRHNADHDELRAAAEDAAEEMRENTHQHSGIFF